MSQENPQQSWGFIPLDEQADIFAELASKVSLTDGITPTIILAIKEIISSDITRHTSKLVIPTESDTQPE